MDIPWKFNIYNFILIFAQYFSSIHILYIEDKLVYFFLAAKGQKESHSLPFKGKFAKYIISLTKIEIYLFNEKVGFFKILAKPFLTHTL